MRPKKTLAEKTSVFQTAKGISKPGGGEVVDNPLNVR